MSLNRNQTGLTSLDKLGDDPRVREIYKDSDGIWCELQAGFGWDGCHGLHENTVKEMLAQVRYIRPCACADCQRTLARMDKIFKGEE